MSEPVGPRLREFDLVSRWFLVTSKDKQTSGSVRGAMRAPTADELEQGYNQGNSVVQIRARDFYQAGVGAEIYGTISDPGVGGREMRIEHVRHVYAGGELVWVKVEVLG